MQIPESDGQPQNAPAPIHKSLEPGSKVTFASALQPQKHFAPSCLTEQGMQTNTSAEQQASADSSIIASFESDANVTVGKPRHPKQQELPILSTDAGTQNDESDTQL
jgi:hypothetical protein